MCIIILATYKYDYVTNFSVLGTVPIVLAYFSVVNIFQHCQECIWN